MRTKTVVSFKKKGEESWVVLSREELARKAVEQTFN
jgi:hypothetical protein